MDFLLDISLFSQSDIQSIKQKGREFTFSSILPFYHQKAPIRASKGAKAGKKHDFMRHLYTIVKERQTSKIKILIPCMLDNIKN